VAKRLRFSKPLVWAPSQRRMRTLIYGSLEKGVNERDDEIMYSFADGLVVLEDLGVCAWKAVVKNFGLGGDVCVWEESNHLSGWNLRNEIQLVKKFHRGFGIVF